MLFHEGWNDAQLDIWEQPHDVSHAWPLTVVACDRMALKEALLSSGHTEHAQTDWIIRVLLTLLLEEIGLLHHKVIKNPSAEEDCTSSLRLSGTTYDSGVTRILGSNQFFTQTLRASILYGTDWGKSLATGQGMHNWKKNIWNKLFVFWIQCCQLNWKLNYLVHQKTCKMYKRTKTNVFISCLDVCIFTLEYFVTRNLKWEGSNNCSFECTYTEVFIEIKGTLSLLQAKQLQAIKIVWDNHVQT